MFSHRIQKMFGWVFMTFFHISWLYFVGGDGAVGLLSSVRSSIASINDSFFGYFKKVTGQTRLPHVAECSLDLRIVLSRVRFCEIFFLSFFFFFFWSKCCQIALTGLFGTPYNNRRDFHNGWPQQEQEVDENDRKYTNQQHIPPLFKITINCC